ncbi:MAG TPA: DUF3300 domain-containing protein [Candidatus Acidoferrum sp.]|nr:DUF3300 domain-containing protein [Candidatus Acidoferrum sp.]
MTKLNSICQAAAVILFCAAIPAGAQEAAEGGVVVAGAPFSDDTLDQMLRPIALYPDPLLAEIFTAATMPEQIVMADRYVNGGGDLGQIAAQPWDASVQALAHYPTVLKWLDDNLAWTTEVGQAFLNQQQDVMASIQRLRLLAQGEGNLQSTPQENVVTDEGIVEIEPANPEVIYVPIYPWDSIYYNPGVYCSFGVAFPIGIWLRHDWDWRNHHVITWGPGHARPGNWWTQAPRNRVAPRGVTVWHGPSRTTAGVGRSVDRGWSADTFRAARTTTPAPAPMTANRGGAGARESRPGTVPGFSTEFRGGATPQTAQRPGIGASQPSGGRPGATLSVPPTVSRPAPLAPGQTGGSGHGGGTSGGAFGGSESSAEARQSSVRGVESRSTMSAPAPAPAARPSPPPQQSQPSQSSGSSRKK